MKEIREKSRLYLSAFHHYPKVPETISYKEKRTLRLKILETLIQDQAATALLAEFW